MKSSKTVTLLLAGLMSCNLALTAVAPVSSYADDSVESVPPRDKTIDVELHKRDVTGQHQETQNTGGIIDALEGLTPVAGVEFSRYNVTTIYHSVRNSEKLSHEQTMKYIQTNWANLKGSLTPIDTAITGPDGTASFRNVELQKGNVYQIYLFEETGGAANMMKAQPMILGFPLKTMGKKVVLYPKNTGVSKDLDVSHGMSADDKVYNFEVGQTLTYTSTVTVPSDIQAMMADGNPLYRNFSFFDKMDSVGTTFMGVKTIKANGVDVTEAAKNAGTFTSFAGNATRPAEFKYFYDFTTTDNAAARKAFFDQVAGKTLTITYDMVINEHANANADLGNTFWGEFTKSDGQTSLKDTTVKVETGGAKFKKHNSKNDQQGLAGAKFVVRDAKGRYAKLSDGTSSNGNYAPKAIEWVATLAEATEMASGTDGQLSIKGLAHGNYALIETVAPQGYELPERVEDRTFNFVIAKGQLDDQQNEIPLHKIANTPTDGYLPLTGSTGIIAFLIVGGLTMAGAAAYQKKRQ